MHLTTMSALIFFSGVAAVWGCFPADGSRAVEIAFGNDEVFALDKLMALGEEDRHYRLEYQDNGDTVVVYQCQVDEEAMVKVGYSAPEHNWRSVLLVVSEDVKLETFDFATAMHREIEWLVLRGVITGPELHQIPEFVQDLAPGKRFFTREQIVAGLNCVAPDTCRRCSGPELFTELPFSPLRSDDIIMEQGGWGWVKNLLTQLFR